MQSPEIRKEFAHEKYSFTVEGQHHRVLYYFNINPSDGINIEQVILSGQPYGNLSVLYGGDTPIHGFEHQKTIEQIKSLDDHVLQALRELPGRIRTLLDL